MTGYPRTDGPPTGLTIVVIVEDPQLGTIDTPNGWVSFLQAVGVSRAEKDRMAVAGIAAVLDDVLADDGLWLTDPWRA